jgi:hypothetical protein
MTNVFIFALLPLQALTIESCVSGGSCGAAVPLSDAEQQELAEGTALRVELMQRTATRGHIQKEVISADLLSNNTARASSYASASSNGNSAQGSHLPEDKSLDNGLQKNEDATDWTELRLLGGSYDLSGKNMSSMFQSFWLEICQANGFACLYDGHFNTVPVDRRFDHKIVVMVQHPYERIASGMRYHRETPDFGLTPMDWGSMQYSRSDFNGRTYQEVLNSFETTEEQIRFEMYHSGKMSVYAMYGDMKINMSEILFVHFEDAGCDEGRERISAQIATHLERDDAAPIKQMLVDSISPTTLSDASTWLFPTLFTANNFHDAERIFPDDLLEVMGYAKYSPNDSIQQYCRRNR